ncbi:DUF456 domain-containing protein [Planctomycetota bacterium]
MPVFEFFLAAAAQEPTFWERLAPWGVGAVFVLAITLCLAGVVLSCVSLSGTWLVVAATVLIALVREAPFPGILTIVIFVIISGLTEVAEFVAGAYGVTRLGGSKLAGLAAVGGGILGLFVGTFIPIPIIGNLIGMLAGSFALAYLVERNNMKKAQDAATIAAGAVIARILMIFVKTFVTLGMASYLFIRIALEG